jgi:acetyl esterase/lipase
VSPEGLLLGFGKKMVHTTTAAPHLQPLVNSIPDSLLPQFDKQYVELYNKYNVGRLNTHQVSLQDYRADPSKYVISYGRQVVYPGNLRITEQTCSVKNGEIKIRICEPESSPENKSRPAYINFHGGGWVFGDLEVGHNFCKRMAIELDCVTFDVDYRLAPENLFPTAIEDS